MKSIVGSVWFAYANALRKSYDFDQTSLKVYDGSSDADPVIGLYCTTVTPAPVTSSGHEARLVFQSDDSVQDNGFHIVYASQP
ncbi:hypothetical protein NPIL_11211, partial [Nephila pilipes]